MVLGKFAIPNAPTDAAVGINNTINYQGRLLNAAGAVVADGNYNMRFKIYKDGDGTLVGNTGGAPAGTLLWTEKRENFNSQGVVVKNGYFSVPLNTICPFTGGSCQGTTNTAIDFNLDTLFLSMDVGGTSVGAGPTYDGEMLPMKRLAAAPYALNAGKVGGLAASVLARTDIGNTMIGTQLFQNASNNEILTVDTTANQITLGKASTLSGKIVFAASGTANTVSLSVTAATAAYNLVLPSTAPALSQCLQNNGTTIGQLTFGSCGGAAGANNALSNLASVAINTSLLPGVTNTIDAGSSSFTFRSGYFATSTLTPLIDTISAGVLTLGTTNATSISLAKNTTLAASQSLAFTGGAFGTRPASPTAGMLYFDTTSNQFIQYNGTKWISDRNTSTKIVAASNSSQALKDAADYIATGTGDQATINSALTAAAGGSVYMAEGTYYESAAISIPNNTTLFGAGAGTLITIPNAQNGNYSIITNTDTTTGTHVTIHDIQIDGNKANQTSGTMNFINMSGMGGSSGSTARDGAKITNMIVRNTYGGDGIILGNSNNNTVTGNSVLGSNRGIFLTGSNNNTVTGNTAQGNSLGIFLSFNTSNNTVTGNTTQGNTYGIFVGGSMNNTVTGNTAQGNTYGIYLGSYLGTPSSNNTIGSNKLHDNGGATDNNGIYLNIANANTITGNDITDTSCTTTCYAINISDATSTGNYLADNRHNGSTANASSINDTAPNTIYANQPDGNGNLINRNQGGFTVGTTSNNSTLSLQGSLTATQLPAPAAPALATAGTAGTTTITYKVTALDGAGETLPSSATNITTANATLSGTNYVTVSWNQVGGAVQYKIYRTATNGTSPTTTGLISTVSSNVFTLKDTGLAATAAAPVANTTGSATISNALILGTSSAVNASIVVKNATNANTVTIVSGATSASYTLTLPTALSASGSCLKDTSGTGTLAFGTCGASTTLQQSYDAAVTPASVAEIVLGNGANTTGLTITDNATNNIAGNLLEVQNNAKTATFLGVTRTGVTIQDLNGNNAFALDSSTGTLRVYDHVTTPVNSATITYSGGVATFAASSGTTQIGAGTGNITANLTGVNDIYNFNKTYTPGAAYSLADYTIARTLTGAANALTGSVLQVTDNSSGSAASPDVLYVNQNNASATGNLIVAKTSGTTVRFSVDTLGNTTASVSLITPMVTSTNSNNANTIKIVSGITSASYQLTLPTAIAGNNQCLQSGTVAGGNVPLTFGACGTAGTFVNLQGSTPGTADVGSINVNGTIISAIGKVGDATNGFTFDPSTGPDFHGTARPTKRIAMSPEFGGAVLRGDGTNNTGTMTTAFDSTNFHNYYNWTTAQIANQDFDVATRVLVPNDFSGLVLSPQICFYAWSDDLTNGTVSVTVNDTANAAVTLSSALFTPGSASTWVETCRTISGSPTITAGGYLTIKATIQAATNKNTRLGEFRIDYLGKF